MTRHYRTALWLFLGLYLAACATPATKNWRSTDFYGRGFGDEHYVTMYGLACLAVGWIDLAGAADEGLGMVAWLANPLALVSLALLLFRRTTDAAVLGAVSFVLSVWYLIDPPGKTGYPDMPQVGAWLWVGSFIALTVAALIRRKSLQAEKRVIPAS